VRDLRGPCRFLVRCPRGRALRHASCRVYPWVVAPPGFVGSRGRRAQLSLGSGLAVAAIPFFVRSLGDPLWDTSSSQGRLLSTLLAAIAEFERELIRERTGDGRKRAMAKGVKFGRKPKLSDYQRKEAIKRRAAGETLAEIAKSYAVDISMISRLS
jgi:hypothetical protein